MENQVYRLRLRYAPYDLVFHFLRNLIRVGREIKSGAIPTARVAAECVVPSILEG